MTQRSPHNDRYKTDQKGHTRKSASAAKPKRALADVTPAQAAKSSQKKPSLWSRAKAAGSSGSSAPAPRIQSEKLTRYNRALWTLWGVALAIALTLFGLQQAHITDMNVLSLLWGIYLALLGGAMYIQFFPMRKERARLIEEAQAASKSGKVSRAAKAASTDKPAKAANASDKADTDGTSDGS